MLLRVMGRKGRGVDRGTSWSKARRRGGGGIRYGYRRETPYGAKGGGRSVDGGKHQAWTVSLFYFLV